MQRGGMNKLSKEADGSYLYSIAGEAAPMCQKARGEYIPHLVSPPLTRHECVQSSDHLGGI
jgi:hypothetical protein